jgi:hypothetical protein
MKPLALFAVVVAVGLIGIALVLHATAHSASANVAAANAPAPLTPAQFHRAADGACARFNRAARALSKRPKPTSLRTFTRRFRSEVSLARRLTVVLNGLTPPRSDTTTYRRLLRINSAGMRMVEGWVHDFDTGQYRQAVLRIRGERRTLNVMNRSANKLARRLGLDACAKNVP